MSLQAARAAAAAKTTIAVTSLTQRTIIARRIRPSRSISQQKADRRRAAIGGQALQRGKHPGDRRTAAKTRWCVGPGELREIGGGPGLGKKLDQLVLRQARPLRMVRAAAAIGFHVGADRALHKYPRPAIEPAEVRHLR